MLLWYNQYYFYIWKHLLHHYALMCVKVSGCYEITLENYKESQLIHWSLVSYPVLPDPKL